MIECCLSGRAQSDLVLASILRVVMAVIWPHSLTSLKLEQQSAGPPRPSQASLQEKISLHFVCFNWTRRVYEGGYGGANC